MMGRLGRCAGALVIAFSVLPVVAAHAVSTLSVPSNTYPTIQSAINAAQAGDTIVVAPGTYHENLDFLGKAITVESSAGAASTIVDAGGSGTVASFHHAETRSAVLEGFTLQNGYADTQATAPGVYDGGGVYIANASPTIENDVITGNRACGSGAGVDVYFGSPLIEGNTITSNTASSNGCSGGWGGGINVQGASQAQVLGNMISNNAAYEGAGVGMDAAGSPVLQNNRISGNTATGDGGGIWAVNQVDAEVVQNLITGNSSPAGAGVYWSTPSGTSGPVFTNDTIAANLGTALYAIGFNSQSRYFNTIISAPSTYAAAVCDPTYGQEPTFDHSDASPAFGAGCVLASGDLTSDPALDTTFHETATSPTVDAGSNSAPLEPAQDLDGKPRIINGTVDMGAYEAGTPAPAASLAPGAVNFGSVPGGSTSTATFTLADTGSEPMSISADSLSGSTYFSKGADGCLNTTVGAGGSCSISVSFLSGAPGSFTGTLSVTDTAGTQTSSLSATGSMGRPSFNPTSLAFGSVKVGKSSGSKTVVVTNTGNATLHIFTLSIQGANPGDFRITADSCSGHALAVGGTCSVAVALRPTALGTRTAVINFPDDDAVTSYNVPLSGTGSKS